MKKFLCFSVLLSICLVTLVGCGKKSGEIMVVTREEGSGTRGAFVELTGILEKSDNGEEKDLTTKEAITQMQTETVITSVSGDVNAIGYVSTGSLNDSVKAVAISAVEPTIDNIKSGSYEISRPFNIAIKNEDDPLVTDFISYILSEEGQKLVSKSYISVDDSLPKYTGKDQSGKIVVAGSTSVSPIMEVLSEEYMKLNPNVKIEIQQTGSSAGIKSAIDGTAQIGMASREGKDSEKESLEFIPIALDGIAVIVNKENPIESISMDTIKNIFTGKVITWDELN